MDKALGHAFALGFEAGARRGEATPRQSERLLRTLLGRPATSSEVDAFGQGSVDGQAGDRFRLEVFEDAGAVERQEAK